MVRASRRSEHRASSVAVCESGREESEEGDELGSGRVGRYGAQDGAAHSEDEVEGPDRDAMEPRRMKEVDSLAVSLARPIQIKQKEQAAC